MTITFEDHVTSIYGFPSGEKIGQVQDGLSVPLNKRETSGSLLEGDMMLTAEQLNIALNGGDMDANRGRGASKNRQWIKGIVPYVLNKSVKNKVLNLIGLKGPTEKAIFSAMEEWQEKTCIRFVPRTNQKDYIEFIADKGCYSFVGRVGGKQVISLAFGCFTHGIAVHEIGHALGFFHEQSRPDRDQYVEIIWDHIKEDTKSNFNKYGRHTIDSLGVGYDYGSIMHYGKRDFAKWPWQTTIRPKMSGFSIGQRDGLSALDVKQANLLYRCPK